MAIFSRRTIQSLIDENCRFLSKGHTRNFINKLNELEKDITLAHEWEIVLLNAFSKIGKVEYEKKFGGTRKADIYFEYNNKGTFLADITTISDKGIDKKNPIDALLNDFHIILKENGLEGNKFHLEVGKHEGLVYKGGSNKIELKLPGRARFSKLIFGKEFIDFITKIKMNPDINENWSLKTSDADVFISYNPKQVFASAHYPSYSVLYSITNNIIYQALEDKASQLIGTEYEGPLGILLCDGGFHNFDKNLMDGGLTYSFRDIINHFLINNKRIDFIITFLVDEPYKIFSKGQERKLKINLYEGQNFAQIPFDFREIINHLFNLIPKPRCTAKNALNYIKRKNKVGLSFWGGYEMSHNKIKISARGLLSLLAEEVEIRDFIKDHGFLERNPFKSALNRGLLIEKADIEKVDSEDDDWVILELKGPDPAISPFRMPPNK